MDRALLERYLADGLSLAQIGERIGRDASTVGYWVKRHGLVANWREKHAPRGGLRRDQLERLVREGASVNHIANELEVSPSTVRHWLKKYELVTERAALLAQNRVVGEKKGRLIRRCRRHGKTEFILDNRGSYRCVRCRSDYVARRRRKVKQILVREAGGACVLCGYDRFEGALHFHHLDPQEKRFSLSHQGATRGIGVVREEAKKCVLLCANCHAEVEAGVSTLAR